MKVLVYAVLKDYFEKEFDISEVAHSITELKEVLIKRNPAVKHILSISRFAVNDCFVDNNFQLTANDSVHIIPPSSGG